jgi:hypothetical protein
MPIEPLAYVAGAVILFAAGVGTRELVEWVRGEVAFSRAVRGELDAFAARWREATGEPWGPIGEVPAHMASPSWARDVPNPVAPGESLPESHPGEEVAHVDDGYPRDEQRMQAGAWRRETVRGDDRMSAWPVNDDNVPRHRLGKPRADDTRSFTVGEVLDAAGVGGTT